MELTTAQKLGLEPLTSEQEIIKIDKRINNLVEANDLPKWAYTKTELAIFRSKVIKLLKEKAKFK